MKFSTSSNIDHYLDNISLPAGWSMVYNSSNNQYSIYALMKQEIVLLIKLILIFLIGLF